MFYRNRAKEIVVMVVAALFVMAFAYSAFAAEGLPSSSSTAESYAGKVIAIDSAKKILTVRSTADDEKMFTLSDNGQVFKCGKPMTLDTLKIGDEVTVAYFEKTSGNYVADFLTLSPGTEKCS